MFQGQGLPSSLFRFGPDVNNLQCVSMIEDPVFGQVVGVKEFVE